MSALGLLRNKRGVIQKVFFITCTGCGLEKWSFASNKNKVEHDLTAAGWGKYKNYWQCPSCLEISNQPMPDGLTLQKEAK